MANPCIIHYNNKKTIFNFPITTFLTRIMHIHCITSMLFALPEVIRSKFVYNVLFSNVTWLVCFASMILTMHDIVYNLM